MIATTLEEAEDRLNTQKAEIAGLITQRDQALQIATFNKKEAEKQYERLIELEAENAELKADVTHWNTTFLEAREGYEKRIADNTEALDALVRDAERYRFIRDVPYTDAMERCMRLQQNGLMDDLIDAIQAAMKETKK